jgi:hypothetical protein
MTREMFLGLDKGKIWGQVLISREARKGGERGNVVRRRISG